jgi:hypothetical protein
MSDYGISALGLTEIGLTGDGIKIGQVELGRIGSSSFGDDPVFYNDFVQPEDVFYRDGAAQVNYNIGVGTIPDHGTQVAGIMISSDQLYTMGIAPAAKLYSAGFGTGNVSDAVIAMTANNLALNGVRATNMSFATGSDHPAGWDGNNLLSEFVDWSAHEQNVLYVIGGDESSGQFPDPDPLRPVPADNFNGMTITALRQSVDTWDRVSSNMRSYIYRPGAICLAAPGNQLNLTDMDNYYEFDADEELAWTSYAAPHVTGTVALLQEAFKGNSDARKHTVMKSVLMTSADVIRDVLGANKTIYDSDGKDWRGTAPDSWGLNKQFGAGALDAVRAYQLMDGGEHNPDPTTHRATIPAIGWSVSTASTSFAASKYGNALISFYAGQYLDITLCWDRVLQLNDVGGTGSFTNSNDTFSEIVATPQLNLYLMPFGATSLSQAIVSVSGANNAVDHIFQQVPAVGLYEIWVRQVSGPDVEYALSWMLVGSTYYIPRAASTGDFNGDGITSLADYDTWRSDYGTSLAEADGNGNGMVDAADYTIWRDHLGQMVSGSGSVAAVPEPSGVGLLAVAGILLGWRRAIRQG